MSINAAISSNNKNLCSVCAAESDGGHFGAETCRACAAFFRRTVAFQKKYKCRSNGNCKIQAPARCACRSCRYSKCLRIGMKLSAVQQNRDPIGTRVEDPTTSPQCDCSQASKTPENTDETNSYHFFDMNLRMTNLWRVQGNYFQLYNIRRTLQTENSSVNILLFNPPRPPKQLNYKEGNEQATREIGVTKTFLDNSFPQFKNLPHDQKNVLFKNFYATFVMMEPGYFAVVHNRTDVFIMPSGDFIDVSRPEVYFADPEKTEPISPDEAIKLYGPSFDIFKRNITDPWHRYGVKDIEFFALLSFVLWDVGLEGQTKETELLAEKCRKEISKELVYYYQNILKDGDYGLRLTNLMSLLQTTQRAVRRLQEDTEIGQVFNAYGCGNDLYELIMMK